METDLKAKGGKLGAGGISKSMPQTATSKDRLFDDKVYLTVLSKRVGKDKVQNKVSKQADEALNYLRSREQFWDQIETGTRSGRQLNNLQLKNYFDKKSQLARENAKRKRRASSRPEPAPEGADKWKSVVRSYRWAF